jgi:hypothetical protein
MFVPAPKFHQCGQDETRAAGAHDDQAVAPLTFNLSSKISPMPSIFSFRKTASTCAVKPHS